MRNITIQAETLGDSIDLLATAFSKKADINGLFILEQALEKAKALRSQEQRNEEMGEILEEHEKRTRERNGLLNSKTNG